MEEQWTEDELATSIEDLCQLGMIEPVIGEEEITYRITPEGQQQLQEE